MNSNSIDSQSATLISVIIPCYNHSHYLSTAIESVLQQTYAHTEIVVVDDGSTDKTKQVAQSYQQVSYIYQNNQGLSAARNTGIRNSTGKYLVFLDADDWLYPQALEINLRYLQENLQAAFVSGAFVNIYEESNTKDEAKVEIHSNHYCHLLQGNYIGVPAAVLFQRWVFEEFKYDETLKACEDYDLYLKIARKYPVVHHTEKIAAYRRHSANMSANISLMLPTVLKVLKRQEKWIKTNYEKQNLKQGLSFWKEYYCSILYFQISMKRKVAFESGLLTIFKYKPSLFIKSVIKYILVSAFK